MRERGGGRESDRGEEKGGRERKRGRGGRWGVKEGEREVGRVREIGLQLYLLSRHLVRLTRESLMFS